MFSVVVLVSGAGTNMLALLDAIEQQPASRVRVAAIGADRESSEGIAAAERRGYPTFVVPVRSGVSRDEWAASLAHHIEAIGPDLLVLSGFMRILPPSFVERFSPRLINTHPALLPAFPGAHAVRDALEAGVASTGATVHLVDAGMDTGPVIAQREVSVVPHDTLDSLHGRIKIVERELLAEVVFGVAAGTIDLAAFAPTGATE